MFSLHHLQSICLPFHVSCVQGTNSISQWLIGVSRDLLKLIGLHSLEKSG